MVDVTDLQTVGLVGQVAGRIFSSWIGWFIQLGGIGSPGQGVRILVSDGCLQQRPQGGVNKIAQYPGHWAGVEGKENQH
jgi:hypothetical protein